MCNEQRATFQRVSMDDAGIPYIAYSLTLTRVQAWTAVIGSILTILGMFGGGVLWARTEMKGVIKDVAEEVLDSRLEAIHSTMEPAFYGHVGEMIDKRIVEHRLSAEEPFNDRLLAIEGRIATLENAFPALTKAMDRNTVLIDRNNDKLDRILERLSK